MVRMQVQLSKSTAYRLTAFEIHKLFLSLLFPQKQSAQSLRFYTQREKNWEWSLELSGTTKKKNCRKGKLSIYPPQDLHTCSCPPDVVIQNMYLNVCWGSFEELGQDLKGQSISPPLCKPEESVQVTYCCLCLGKFHYDSLLQGILTRALLTSFCLFTTLQVKIKISPFSLFFFSSFTLKGQ